MRGEQQILVGANMRTQKVNPVVLAMSARSAMGTISGNAQNFADPKNHIPLTKDGHTVYAIRQNRIDKDGYSKDIDYKIIDERAGTAVMVESLDDLLSQGYVRADVKADTQNKQRIAAGKGVGGGSGGAGGMPYKVSDSDQAWSIKISTIPDGAGGESYNPYMAMCLDILMGKHGLGRNAAYIALDSSIKKMMGSALKENPKATPEQVQQAAYRKLASELSGNGAPEAPATATPLANPAASAAQKNPLQKNLVNVATGTDTEQPTTAPQEEPYAPEEGHQRMVNGLADMLQATPGALKDGWNWWRESMKNNAE